MTTTNIYLDLKESFLEKNKDKMREEALKGDGEKGHLILSLSEEYAQDPIVKIEEIDEENNSITIRAEGEYGSVWLTAELTIDQLIWLIEVATKKLNKVKTVLEAVK